MKKLFILSGLLLLSTAICFSQGNSMNSKFEKAMSDNLKVLDTAKSPGTFVVLANNFDRIANAEKKEWLPYYYAGFCYTMLALYTPDPSQIDPLADKAESYLQKAGELSSKNSEISCLYGMITAARITVDPMSRWQQMSGDLQTYVARSKMEDPNNPRPYLLEANTTLRTPESMGGGKSAAKPLIEEAIKKYDTFKPESALYPNWGKGNAVEILQGIGKG
jgi:hypothetical protein